MRVALLFAFLGALTLGCDPDEGTDAGPGGDDAGGGEDAGSDAGEDAGGDAGYDAGVPCDGPPGLYVDPDCTVVADDLRIYTPQFELWADGASKERYIYLPPGERIDTTDPDHWVYPVGTRIYKTFSLDGLRLETRLLEKTRDGVGVGSWEARVFAWTMEQDEVIEVTSERPDLRENVLGTEHDIPDGALCIRCHIGQNGHDMVNGFTAFQLNHDATALSLEDLATEDLVTNAIPLADAEVPGDADDQAVLGYLHTNCGYCHREGGDPAAALRMFYMRLEVGQVATVEDTQTWRTGVNTPSTITFGDALCRFMPGNATNSVAVHRASTRDPGVQMPPVATEQVHTAGVAMISAWVDSLLVAPAAECSP